MGYAIAQANYPYNGNYFPSYQQPASNGNQRPDGHAPYYNQYAYVTSGEGHARSVPVASGYKNQEPQWMKI
ncbi:hypothetical protein DPMN_064469 [Dreissena polymorpha]|uniref:Uncharacterized protein n=1 Tax=Dreissena polymorpha TaxID=45954 RepID=A0A9D4CCT7_DREPO|nr:hypothetical protein DPMN_064469 [Dreissena polymorpha]